MLINWKNKGCEVCRRLWESGGQPRLVVVSTELHSKLHRCDVCGTFWEQLERFADVIEESDARKLYPNAFSFGEKE
jgi:hypothetical protein